MVSKRVKNTLLIFKWVYITIFRTRARSAQSNVIFAKFFQEAGTKTTTITKNTWRVC